MVKKSPQINTLLIASTKQEALGIFEKLENCVSRNYLGWEVIYGQLFKKDVALLLTGVGIVKATASISSVLCQTKFSRVLQFGIGGAYPHSQLNLRDLTLATSECDVQSGIETPINFFDLTELGFSLTNVFPNKLFIKNEWYDKIFQILPNAQPREIATVVTCSGTNERANYFEKISGASVEVMEGFPAAWLTNKLNIPFAELRVISNTTGNRDKQHWDLSGACDMVTAMVLKLFLEL